jgi:hypothetical protein
MKTRLSLPIVLVALVVASFPLAATSTASASTTPTPSASSVATSQRVWVVGAPTESFATQVQRAVASQPSTVSLWQHTLSGLTATISAGTPVALPGDAQSPQQQLAQISAATVAVTAATSAHTQSAVTPDTTPASSYVLRGYSINNGATWQVPTEIDGAYCDVDGCETTDVTRQTWKITPGRTGDKFSFTSIRTGEGNLTQIYANLSVLCNGVLCGTGTAGKTGPEDGSGSGSPIVTHSSTAGKSIVDRIEMRAYFVPNGGTYYDRIKTGTANCGTGDSYLCVF